MSTASPVVLGDPRISAIALPPTNDDDLVDGRETVPELAWSHLYEEPTGAYAHLRRGLVERLLRAQDALPEGFRLLLVEGHRPAHIQQEYYDSYAAQLVAERGPLPAEELRTLASRYISPPDVAPHVSGAAIDLVLTSAGGEELDMGTRINATPEESEGACYLAADNISAEARAHREVLTAAMGAAGIVNYPPEWWHWSYGDRYWAFAEGRSQALYGPVRRYFPAKPNPEG